MNPFESMALGAPSTPPEEEFPQEETVEAKPFDQNAAVEQERDFLSLESLEKKAKNAAKVMAFLSVLSFGATYPKEAEAAGPGVSVKVETTERGQRREVREERLSPSGRFFESIVESAQKERSKVFYSEDAEELLDKHFDRFVSEYFNPTQGRLRNSSFGVKDRAYTDVDLRSIKENAADMKEILLDMHAQYEVDDVAQREQQINELIERVEHRASYVGKVENALLQQLNRQLNIKITIPGVYGR